MNRRIGLCTIQALSYEPLRMLGAALVTRSDLYIGSSEAGMWVAYALSLLGKKVGLDVEDWYSRNTSCELPSERRYMAALERRALHASNFVITPSRSMAWALCQEYGRDSSVIYNSDPASLGDVASVPAPQGPMRLVWFSRTVGTDRGIEEALSALQSLGEALPWSLDLIGDAVQDVEALMMGQRPQWLRNRVHFLRPVSTDELPAVIARYDVGLALERMTPLNKCYTVSNKILRYLQSGLHVAATATSGHTEIESEARAVRCYREGHPDHLADILKRFATGLPELRGARSDVASHANVTFGYETQVPHLLELVDKAVRAGG